MSGAATRTVADGGADGRAVWRSSALDGPNEDDAVHRLILDNPWWTAGERWQPGLARWPRRRSFERIFNHLHRALRRPDGTAAPLPAVVTGPRRTGKSVLLLQVVHRLLETGSPPETLWRIDGADPALMGWALDALAGLAAVAAGVGAAAAAGGAGGGRNGGTGVIVIDHADHRPDWLAGLRRVRIRFPDAIIIAAASLRPVDDGTADLSAGLIRFSLPPIGFAEYLALTGAESRLVEPMRFGGRTMYSMTDTAGFASAFVAWINGGGFPETVLLPPAGPGRADEGAGPLRQQVAGAWLGGELAVRHGIAAPLELQALLVRLARNTGGEMSIEGLAAACGLAKNTTRRYIEFLEQAGMIWRMPRLHPGGRRFSRMRTFKAHLTSPSLYAALFGPVGADSPVLAALIETAVVAQWQGVDDLATLHFARLAEGAVDLIGVEDEGGERPGRPAWACALAGSDGSLNGEGIAGLIAFARHNPGLRWLGATTRTKAGLRSHDGLEVWHRPASLYCYEVGQRYADGG